MEFKSKDVAETATSSIAPLHEALLVDGYELSFTDVSADGKLLFRLLSLPEACSDCLPSDEALVEVIKLALGSDDRFEKREVVLERISA